MAVVESGKMIWILLRMLWKHSLWRDAHRRKFNNFRIKHPSSIEYNGSTSQRNDKNQQQKKKTEIQSQIVAFSFLRCFFLLNSWFTLFLWTRGRYEFTAQCAQ